MRSRLNRFWSHLQEEPETGVLICPEIPDVELDVITLNSISSLISFSIKAKSNDSRFIFLHSRIIVVVKESKINLNVRGPWSPGRLK